ncbi:DUF7305 domain-containing protein [Coraliomargarita sinensis]|nr:hypothetical protein [Coraliomargarita sinensis]
MKKGIIQSRYGRPMDSRRGSAMLTSVIFSFLVMTLMGSYLYLSSGEYRISTRSFLSNASFNLAEGGIDLALDAIQSGNSTGWTKGIDGSGRRYWARAYTDYDLGGNITGEIKIVILDPQSQTPEIYTEGLAKGHVAGDVKKQLYANLTSGFLPFSNGFNTKRGIVLKGNNVTFDSYDSRNGPYGGSNINSEITIATTSVDVDSVDIGNADVYGYVATGKNMPDVGPKGSITDYDNPGKVDNSRITTDYYAEFPDVEAPGMFLPFTSIPSSGTILGGNYDVSNWSLSGSDTVYITGPTRVKISGDIDVTGTASIVIEPTGSLEIYTDDDINIAGNGIVNETEKPEKLMIFGVDKGLGDDEIKISGNGSLYAAVYAPNAVVTLNGGGSSGAGQVYGAVVGYDADLVGNAHFSYDEALEEYNLGSGGYEIDEWVELAGVSMTAMNLDMGKYGL